MSFSNVTIGRHRPCCLFIQSLAFGDTCQICNIDLSLHAGECDGDTGDDVDKLA